MTLNYKCVVCGKNIDNPIGVQMTCCKECARDLKDFKRALIKAKGMLKIRNNYKCKKVRKNNGL